MQDFEVQHEMCVHGSPIIGDFRPSLKAKLKTSNIPAVLAPNSLASLNFISKTLSVFLNTKLPKVHPTGSMECENTP